MIAAKHIQTGKENEDMHDQLGKKAKPRKERTITGILAMIHTAWRKSSGQEAAAGKQAYKPVNCFEHLSVDELFVALRASEPSNRYPTLP